MTSGGSVGNLWPARPPVAGNRRISWFGGGDRVTHRVDLTITTCDVCRRGFTQRRRTDDLRTGHFAEICSIATKNCNQISAASVIFFVQNSQFAVPELPVPRVDQYCCCYYFSCITSGGSTAYRKSTVHQAYAVTRKPLKASHKNALHALEILLKYDQNEFFIFRSFSCINWLTAGLASRPVIQRAAASSTAADNILQQMYNLNIVLRNFY